MLSEDPAAVGRRALERLQEERTAEFVSWVSIGEVDLEERDVNATGTANFATLESRARERRLASAIMRDGAVKAKSSRNPLDKFVVSAGVWILRRLHTERIEETFYTAAQRWWRTPLGTWATLKGAVARPGYRDAGDPILVVECLAALIGIEEVTPGQQVRGTPTTCVRARADLRRIEDRLDAFLNLGDSRRRAVAWFEEAPVKLWIDDSGLPRRISYAPTAANTTEPLWRTLELFAFGVALEPPTLPAGSTGA